MYSKFQKYLHHNYIIPLAKRLMSLILEERFHNIDVPNDCDEDCEYLLETKDPFNTGDSLTEYECICTNYEECPIIEEITL